MSVSLVPVTLVEIEKARKRIAPYIHPTPTLMFQRINETLQKEVLFKCENLQNTGSFKIRGAANCILSELEKNPPKGLVAASAGNHAQGVASIGKQLKIPTTIVMPTVTPQTKVANTQYWGAKVVLHGEVFDESYEKAQQISKEEGLVYIPPFKDDRIMTGQGTIGLELSELPGFSNIEAVIVSIGGGGLISGIAAALKAKNPKIKIYGVTAQNAPSAYLAFKEKKAIEHPVTFTIAEGVATKRCDTEMSTLLRGLVDEVYSISEDSIASAIAMLAERSHLVVEGAGALPLALLLENKISEKKVAAVLSGGNIDPSVLSQVLQRGLVKQGRLARLLVRVVDRPGSLHFITQILAEKKANILQVMHQRANLHLAMGETEIELDLETRSREHTDSICAALRERGLSVQVLS